MTNITKEQFVLIQGFMLHCWNVFHNQAKSEFDFWAEQLDNAKISWYVQNQAAYLMDKRENGFKYFRNLLKSKDIEIIQ